MAAGMKAGQRRRAFRSSLSEGRKTHLESVESFRRVGRRVQVDTPNTTHSTGIPIKEPDGVVILDGHGELGGSCVVVCVTEGRIETVNRLIGEVRRNTRRGECRLRRSVVSLRDCDFYRQSLLKNSPTPRRLIHTVEDHDVADSGINLRRVEHSHRVARRITSDSDHDSLRASSSNEG